MARIKVSGQQIDQITNQVSQMWALQLATMAGAVITGIFVVKLLNKGMNKIWYEFGITYYILWGIFGVAAVGILQAMLPNYAELIAYAFIVLGVISLATWIYLGFFSGSKKKIEEEKAE